MAKRNGAHNEYGLNLPKTAFPMRANLPQQEPDMLRYWDEIDLYRSVRARAKGRPPFIVHDGPPFSNGDIHLGHALNKILKDIVVKFRTMQGYDAPFVPGWDTHGLPTEIVAIRSMHLEHGPLDPVKLRHRCAEMARKAVDVQRKQFVRLGILADWDRPYLTMQPGYEGAVLDTFAQLVERGLIYRGKKPVHWCTACETALAEAEIEYREHESPSIYVAFPVVSLPEGLFPGEDIARMAAVIWTTTPWMLPANVAVAAHPEVRYALVTDEGDEEGFTYLVAGERVEDFAAAVEMASPRVLAETSGRQLAGALFLHPFLARHVPLVLADYVTLEAGTGLAQVAPGHGEDDFITGLTYGLPMIQPVGPSGIYGPEAGPFAGKAIYAAQEEMLVRMDRDGTLLAYDTILHQYPHCWRCRGPIITRAIPQWFLAVERLHEELRQAIDAVEWLPAWGGERMRQMVTGRPDWCISRQRSWGVPIPALYCTQCETPLLTAAVVRWARDILQGEGSDAWFQRPAEDFLPPHTACAQCGGTDFRQETDVFDVWFDSGCSHAAVLERRPELRWPADLYLEGQDQYRGWFQVSLLTSIGAGRGQAPYRSVLAHGFVLDHTGQKHAKLLGNIADAQAVVRKYGADILRLWVASVDTRADMTLAEDAFTQVGEAYRRLRNTVRFLLGNLYDFTPEMALPYSELEEIDRWALHRLQELIARVTAAYERYEFHRATHVLTEYAAGELSACYLDIVKERLYTLPADARARRSAQTVFLAIAETLAGLFAPILSFTAEEIWQHLPEGDRPESVQLADWQRAQEAWHDPALAEKWARVLAVRAVVLTALDAARTSGRITQPAAAQVAIYAQGALREDLASLEEELATVLCVSSASVAALEDAPAEAFRPTGGAVAVRVTPALGEQCPRCRRWRRVGEDPAQPRLCVQCAATSDVLQGERT